MFIYLQIDLQGCLQVNFKRTTDFAIIGLFYYGPFLHFWYCHLLPKLSNRFFLNKSKLLRVLGCVLLDQALFTPIFYLGFYLIDGLLNSVSWKSGFFKGLQLIESKMIETLVADLAVWPLATGINLWFVPLQYQVLFNNFISLFWDIFLTKFATESPK
jgi:hypothetical protein